MGFSDFSWALLELKDGKKLRRKGWNGKNQWVVRQKGYPDGVMANANSREAYGVEEGTIIKVAPYLVLKNEQDVYVNWIPSIGDIFAEDWEIV